MTSSIYLPPPADAPNAAARAACWAASIQPCPTAPHRPRSQAAFNYPFPPLACEGHCWYGLVLPSKLTNVNDVDEPADDEPADVDEPASTAVRRTASTRLQPLHGGQNAAVGRSAPCRPPWQLIAAQLQDSHTAAGAAHHVSSLAADLCVPRPDGRRPKGLAPRGGSRARHRTSKQCAPAPRTRPIARFPARSALSVCPSDASTAAFPPWQVD